MKFKLRTKILAISLGVSLITIMTNLPSLAQRGMATFFCGNYKGNPATIANHSRRGNVPLLVWKSTDFGSQYSPQTRCQIISERFQRTSENGTLNYIVEGRTPNGYSALCASSKAVWILDPCPESQILLTLRRGVDNPKYMIKKIGEMNRDVSTLSPLEQSGILEESPDGDFVRISVPRMLFYSQDE